MSKKVIELNPTQKEVVRGILENQGYITNFFAMDNRITIRLGAIIYALKKDGYVIDGEFIETKGSLKNYKYTLVSKPKGSQDE